jgi:glycosidase
MSFYIRSTGNTLQGEISPEYYQNNRYRVEHFRLGGLPDLKANEWMLKQQRLMVKALVDMGFDGFRIDAAKHLVEEQVDNISDQPCFIMQSMEKA